MNRKMIDEELKRQLDELQDLSIEDRREAIAGMAELHGMRESIFNRYFKLAVDSAAIVLPLIFYAVWMGVGFQFEETGTFTSTVFRGLFNKFKPNGL